MSSEIAEKLSRRTLLRRAAGVVGAAGSTALVVGCQPMAQPAPPPPPPPMVQPAPPPPPPPMKQSKAEAAYRGYPHGRQHCSVCRHFITPNDCEAIQGPVSPRGWCRNFVPAVPGGERG